MKVVVRTQGHALVATFAPSASNHHTLHEIASLPLGLGEIWSLLVPHHNILLNYRHRST